MNHIFPESRHNSVIGNKEPLGKRILELEAHWIKQLHTQILAYKRNVGMKMGLKLRFFPKKPKNLEILLYEMKIEDYSA